MVDLIPLTPCAGLLPLSVGGVTLTEVSCGAVTFIAPFKGMESQVSGILEAGCGVPFPAPNRMETRAGVRVLWVGPGKALLMGSAAPEGIEGHAALVDQSDAFATVCIADAQSGDDARAVLARLMPVDTGDQVFDDGCTARSLVGHMTASVTRVGTTFEIMVMRSMAASLVHDLRSAMETLEARRNLLLQNDKA